ncbi:peptide/nickel transport system ATP-binding protein [Rhizobiales bacterium GAS188]|nr:peptide/nickel transport system ATP-binding protein [Rhizobiales bacterium GAS188]
MSLLAAQGLTVETQLRDGQRLPVLSDIAFTLEPGKVLGLVGESGAGKSMIGRTIAQLLPAGFSVTSGSLSFAGEDLIAMEGGRRRHLLGREIAFIPQEPLSALNPVLTVGAQFGEHLARIGVATLAERREQTRAMLEAVHLPRAAELVNQYPHQLSGGMCQRVLIAMAFASRPRLVIADEPTTALDVTIQARIVALMAEMRDAYGAAVVFITHDLRLAAQICDDVLVLYAGRPVEKGPARSLLAAPLHPYARCLQLAIPSLSTPERQLYALAGEMPGIARLNALQGCRFAPRCPNAGEICRQSEPHLATVSPGREAACFRVEMTSGIAASTEAQATEKPGRNTPLLAVAGLTKRYRTRRGLFGKSEITAVNAVSFEVAEDEFVGIVGESGSGKSTIAKLVVGLERATSGRIELGGLDVANPNSEARRRRIDTVQMVFQDPQSALNPRRRVASIVTQVLEAAAPRLATRERLARAAQLLAEVGLSGELGGRYPSQLSGGQKQRVNIARALCATPKLLLADEIASGLDVSVQAQLIALLRRLRRELSFSMLFISHDLAVVRNLCDRVLVMWRGEIVESGRTADIFASPRHPYTRTLLAAVPPDDPSTVWAPLQAPAAELLAP